VTENQRAKISKKLSYVLRHAPESIGLTLDNQGWANVKDLMIKIEIPLSLPAGQAGIEALVEVVETNEKKRFAFNDDMTLIRASQGHSIDIDLAYQPTTPPDFLFHGTATRFIESIQKEGLLKGSRHHVHLSLDESTAQKVGMRHGKPIILTIKSKDMYEAGHLFYVSENDVWLTEHVPVAFIVFP
jgi:putative RNA 2'-phosphotransferase